MHQMHAHVRADKGRKARETRKGGAGKRLNEKKQDRMSKWVGCIKVKKKRISNSGKSGGFS